MLRISVTTLEQFRRLFHTDYANETELIASVRREPFAPSWQMIAGSAWDWCVQFDSGHLAKDGYYFDAVARDHARKAIGKGLYQVKQTVEVDTKFGPVTLVGVADQINGLVIHDHKACFSSPNAGNYDHSLQWRFYLWMFGGKRFKYNLFDFKEPKKNGYCELDGIISFSLWPYDRMRDDCMRWLTEFLAWAESRNLMKYLESPYAPRKMTSP